MTTQENIRNEEDKFNKEDEERKFMFAFMFIGACVGFPIGITIGRYLGYKTAYVEINNVLSKIQVLNHLKQHL